MAKNYEELAKDIIKNVGGVSNIDSAHHCATRLRFTLKDSNLPNDKELESLNGVTAIVKKGDQYQVIIGASINEVYEQVAKLLPADNTPDDDTIENNQLDDTGIMQKVIDFLTAVFTPIITPLSGAGMLRALMAILVTFNLITGESQTYYVLNFVSDSIFYFLPILLAFSTATRVKANPYIAAVLGGVLLHPSFSALVTAGETVSLFGLPVGLFSYGSSVIPIILIVIIQKYVENISRKITPDTIKIVIVPMLTLLFTSIIALVVVGPLGFYAGEVAAVGFAWLSNEASWLPPTLIGALLPIMVMFGMHHAVAPVGIVQLTATGSEGIFGPGAMVSNVAMGAAMFGTALGSKRENDKQLSYANGITAFMGITEPALYAVALPKKYPLIAAMIGGGIGGLYAGITSTVRYATGISGIPAVVLYIGDDFGDLINISIAIVITIVVTGILSFIFSRRYEEENEIELTMVEDETKAITLNNTDIPSPVAGQLIELSEVNDEVFSSGALGKGVGIKPTDGNIYAPFDAEIVSLFPTNHAIGLKSDTGVELLIHVGIDTVELNGKYFKSVVNQGQKVNKGDLLINFEPEKIAEAGYETDVIVVVTNTDQFETVESVTTLNLIEDNTVVIKANI